MRRGLTAMVVAGLLAVTGCSSSTNRHDAGAAPAGVLQLDGDGVARPDRALSPGSSATGSTTADVCSPTYVRTVSFASDADRRETFSRYGLPYPAAQAQHRLDHVVPLELGGDNSPANLWPEPVVASTADRRNAVGIRLRDLVCGGVVPLATAQRAMADDWYAAWNTYVASASAPPVPAAATEATPTPTPTPSPTLTPTRRPTAPPTPEVLAAAPALVPVPSTAPAPAPAPAAPLPSSVAPAPRASTAPTVPATAASPTTAAASPVRGQPCSPVGATGVNANGRTLVCNRVNNSSTGVWRLPGN